MSCDHLVVEKCDCSDSKAVKNTQAISLEKQISSNQAEMSPTQEYNLQRPNKWPSIKETENLTEFWGRRGKESELEIEDLGNRELERWGEI